MIHTDEVIVVEGKYDKERLKKITDAPIICTHGFELYRSKKIINTLRSLAKERGIIILTDSDYAGNRIRGYIKGCLGKEANIKNVYIPRVHGKEKRKEKPGAEGILGVEGMDYDVLERILKEVSDGKNAACSEANVNNDDNGDNGDNDDKNEANRKTERHESNEIGKGEKVEKSEFFADGFSGKPDSAEKRKRLARYFKLPDTLSANALLDMINRVYGAERYREAVRKIR